MLSFEEFVDLFIQYIQQEDTTSAAAEDARQKLEDSVPFHWIMCKWNRFKSPDIDSLATVLADEIWTPNHCLIHRLYEIGHFKMLTVVFYKYLRLSLKRENSQLQILQSIPLLTFVQHFFENFLPDTHDCVLSFEDIQQSERDRVQQLANCCADPQLQQLVVVFAALVADWSLVSHTLRVRSFPSTFISKLYVWLDFAHLVPSEILSQLLLNLDYKTQGKTCMHLHYLRKGELEIANRLWSVHLDDNGINYIGEFAAKICDWRMVRLFFPLCENKSSLALMCSKSASYGQLDIPVRILRSLTQKSTHPAVLYYITYQIIRRVNDRQILKTLLVTLALLGISTHFPSCSSGFCIEQFDDKPVSVIKTALKTGMMSYTDCYEYVQEPCPTSDNSQQFVEEMEAEGTRPLWEVCRLTISHRIGYGAGRHQRIDALPYSETLKRYVRFYDLDIPDEQQEL